MSRINILTFKNIAVVLSSLLLIAIFNSNRPAPQTVVQSEFLTWYQEVNSDLQAESSPEHPTRKVSVRVKVFSDDTREQKNDWIVPAAGEVSAEQKARLTRVLQIIKEANVFDSQTHLTAPTSGGYVEVTITDYKTAAQIRKFEAFIPSLEVGGNIQLQNTLKLLELYYSSASETPIVNPSQL